MYPIKVYSFAWDEKLDCWVLYFKSKGQDFMVKSLYIKRKDYLTTEEIAFMSEDGESF